MYSLGENLCSWIFDRFSIRIESSTYNFTGSQTSFWLLICKLCFSSTAHVAPVSGSFDYRTIGCSDMTWILHLFVMTEFMAEFMKWAVKVFQGTIPMLESTTKHVVYYTSDSELLKFFH